MASIIPHLSAMIAAVVAMAVSTMIRFHPMLLSATFFLSFFLSFR
jgi:hypothetical protein